VLAALFSSVSAFVVAQDKPLIEPDVRPQVVDESLIDSENFELGTFVGVINIEDFESSLVYGARLAYHLSEGLFFEANYGMAEAGETSFEKLGNVQLLSDRDYSYYNFGLGYNILPGEAFFAGKYAFNTNFYLVAGVGSTDFAGDSELTANFGAGYQILLNDWLSIHFSAREHLYRTEITGEEKLVFNSEFSTGLSVFF
jgi:outer membrane beta-barrel protein